MFVLCRYISHLQHTILQYTYHPLHIEIEKFRIWLTLGISYHHPSISIDVCDSV